MNPEEVFSEGYDQGWNHAKPFWEEKFQQRLIENLNNDAVIQTNVPTEWLEYFVRIIDETQPEDV